MSQLQLFDEAPASEGGGNALVQQQWGVLPTWWSEDDSEALRRYYEWKETDFLPQMPDGVDSKEWYSTGEVRAALAGMDEWLDKHCWKWQCRRCEFFATDDGESGECHGPEAGLPYVEGDGMCEQWMPRHDKDLLT